MKKLVLLFAALLVAGCGEKSLSGSAIEKALGEAVEYDSLQERNDLYYQVNKIKPYSGWAKVLYDSGQAEQLFGIKDGKREGRTLVWEDDGTKTFEATYKNGSIEGYFEVSEWYSGPKEGFPAVDELINVSDGARVAGTIRKGKMHGKWVISLVDGRKYAELNYKNSELNGPFTKWHENGQKLQEGTFKDDKLDGPYTTWYENGQKASEGTLKDGKPDDSSTTWHPKGQKSSESSWKGGTEVSSREWDRNGNEFSDGNGLRTNWDLDGTKYGEGMVKDFKMDGVWEYFHSDGTKWMERTYKDGKEVSNTRFRWRDNGTKRSERTYKDGEEVSAKYWNSKGEEVETEEEAYY